MHSDIFYLWTLQLTKIPKTRHVQYTPVRSDISLPKCPIHSREMSDKFESTPSNSDYLVGHRGCIQSIWSNVRVDI